MKAIASLFSKFFGFPLQPSQNYWLEDDERPVPSDNNKPSNEGYDRDDITYSVQSTEERVSGFESRLRVINRLGNARESR